MNLSPEQKRLLEEKHNIKLPDEDIFLEGGFNKELNKLFEDGKERPDEAKERGDKGEDEENKESPKY